MTLTRVWTPTRYYSGGGSKRILVIHTMEGFTGPNGAYDCATYFQGNVGASSHVCIDNNRGKIWEGVTRNNSAWTTCGYNYDGISCEQSGYASWSRQYWLDNRSNQLHNIADWLREESAATGIPLVDINASAAQGSGRGVCYHSELGSYGCGHSDPGSGWPLDIVLEWARNGTTQPIPPEEGTTTEEDEDMYSLPPKEVSALTLEVSLNGMYSNMGVCSDASTYPDSTHIRAAFHTGQGSWQVIQVYSDPGHEKVVVTPTKKFDAVRLDRLDNNPCVIVPNFGR